MTVRDDVMLSSDPYEINDSSGLIAQVPKQRKHETEVNPERRKLFRGKYQFLEQRLSGDRIT
jgi:hypothetical protein